MPRQTAYVNHPDKTVVRFSAVYANHCAVVGKRGSASGAKEFVTYGIDLKFQLVRFPDIVLVGDCYVVSASL
jgi:hypothetical protein